MSSDALTPRLPGRPLRSKRLLALAGDERIVEQIRRGNELAFEIAFERHGAGILAFCRHMLGSREEAEDAVQHTFAAAFRDLARGSDRTIALRPWLYTIARNRCLSLLRARREEAAELHELPTEGLNDEVERRAELRELLADVRELPEDQRAALLLAEAAGMSHTEIAEVLDCEPGSVKGLVFRARSSLIERREARDTPCNEIREQLATLRGGALRRNELRHHLRRCPGCAGYREEVRRQRQMLAVALPVVPGLGLKSKVLAAAGFAGGGAGGGAAAGGLAGGAAIASFGSGAVAKVTILGALATGGMVAGQAVVGGSEERPPAPAAAGQAAPAGAAVDAARKDERGDTVGERISAERSHGLRGIERRSERSRGRGPMGFENTGRARAHGARPAPNGGRKVGDVRRAEKVESAPGGSAGPRTREPVAPRSRPEVKAVPAPRLEPTAPVSPPTAAPEPATEPLPEAPVVETVTPPE
ncbi:MAG TPA: sigma-70 family RNA polymerase sigma factor [Thermoleophilaceae bacterium]|nr:sigma-70 family RNA polymerase sigma factor [Thermoleophilaceae bacterium]